MPPLGPIKRNDLVRYLRQLGFDGPYSGGRHQFMIRASVRVRLPNPHEGDINGEFFARILRHADVSRAEWEAL
jgi:hypothetical protein